MRGCARASGLLILALTAAACAVPAASPVATAVQVPTERPTASARPSPAASEPARPLAEELPTHLGEVELHTFETGRDLLGRLAAELDVPPQDLEVAYASEHGARFVEMYAIRLAGRSSAELAQALEPAAYIARDATVSADVIDGTAVTVIDSPSEGSQVGTSYLVVLDETLVVIRTFERADAQDALAALP